MYVPFVSHIAELSDAHLYFTKFRKFLGALPPLEKSLATPLDCMLYDCMTVCSNPADGIIHQGVKPPLKLKLLLRT